MGINNAAFTTGMNAANMSTSAYNAAHGQAQSDYLQNTTLPFNLAASLQSGSQVNVPGASPVAPAAIPPSSTLAGAYGQGQMNAANISSYNQMLGGVTGPALNYLSNHPLSNPFGSGTQAAAPVSDFSQPMPQSYPVVPPE
jgi:hypothetical protein